VISKVYDGALPPDKLIAAHLIVVLAVYAVIILAGHRKWLKPNELKLVGAAMLFWAIGWLLQPILSVVRSHYTAISTALPISIGLIAPVVAAMVFGLLYVAKRGSGAGAIAAPNRPAR
jgi:hypothetical protein